MLALRALRVESKSRLNAALIRWMSAAKAGAHSGHGGHEPNPLLWKRIFIFVCIPAIIVSFINAYLMEKEHHEHYVRPEFVPYDFRYIRNKPFPWGDGNHSLFHNPKYNALPEGWEELPEEEEKHH